MGANGGLAGASGLSQMYQCRRRLYAGACRDSGISNTIRTGRPPPLAGRAGIKPAPISVPKFAICHGLYHPVKPTCLLRRNVKDIHRGFIAASLGVHDSRLPSGQVAARRASTAIRILHPDPAAKTISLGETLLKFNYLRPSFQFTMPRQIALELSRLIAFPALSV